MRGFESLNGRHGYFETEAERQACMRHHRDRRACDTSPRFFILSHRHATLRRAQDDALFSLSTESASERPRFVSERENNFHYYKKCLFHQFVHSPADVQSPQITVVLTHAQEYHRNARGVHHADERADHVAHCVALGDDEAVHADAVVAELALRS